MVHCTRPDYIAEDFLFDHDHHCYRAFVCIYFCHNGEVFQAAAGGLSQPPDTTNLLPLPPPPPPPPPPRRNKNLFSCHVFRQCSLILNVGLLPNTYKQPRETPFPSRFLVWFYPLREGQGQAGLKQGWLVGFYFLSFFYYFYYFIYFTFPAFSSKGFLESFQFFLMWWLLVPHSAPLPPPPKKLGSEGKEPEPGTRLLGGV